MINPATISYSFIPHHLLNWVEREVVIESLCWQVVVIENAMNEVTILRVLVDGRKRPHKDELTHELTASLMQQTTDNPQNHLIVAGWRWILKFNSRGPSQTVQSETAISTTTGCQIR